MTQRISGSQSKMVKWQIVCALNVGGQIFWVELPPGWADGYSLRGAALAVSSLPSSWCRGKSFLMWFLCAVGLGVSRAGEVHGEGKEQRLVQFSCADRLPAVRKCVPCYSIGMYTGDGLMLCCPPSRGFCSCSPVCVVQVLVCCGSMMESFLFSLASLICQIQKPGLFSC